MKNILKITMAFLIAAIAFVACEKKVDPLPQYVLGNAVQLTVTPTTVAPAVADSDKVALTLSWTNPNYSVDSSSVKYVIEIDSTGHNFSKAVATTVMGSRSATFTNKQINNILLGFGAAYNTAYNIDVRVTSSYSNNNELYRSNVVVVNFKTYLVPPKVTPPTSGQLFLVGDATVGGWNNPVPVPTQQFTKLDNTTYQGTFYLIGGKQYLMLPVNGDWTNKYAVADASVPGLSAGGDFGYNGSNNTFNSNFPAPATTGLYTVKADFQKGKFTVTASGAWGLMYVPGDYQGWTPATAPTLGSPKNDGTFDGYINVPSGGTYQFKMTPAPDWTNSYGDVNASGTSGNLVKNGGNNMMFAGAGFYQITANTNTNKWTALKTSWSLIGSFAASNWSTDIPMTYSASSNTWTGTITVAAGDQFKFRANNDWTVNLGDAGGTGIGTLSYGGNNIGDATKNTALTAGTKTVTLYLGNGGYYIYTVK